MPRQAAPVPAVGAHHDAPAKPPPLPSLRASAHTGVAIRLPLPVHRRFPARIKTHFSFRSCAKRETVLRLAALPFPGLFHDGKQGSRHTLPARRIGPPRARLRIKVPCCIPPGGASPFDPPLAVSIRVVLRRARRVSEGAGGTFAAKAGSKLCLRPGQGKSESSPPKCRFSCHFSLLVQREVDETAHPPHTGIAKALQVLIQSAPYPMDTGRFVCIYSSSSSPSACSISARGAEARPRIICGLPPPLPPIAALIAFAPARRSLCRLPIT